MSTEEPRKNQAAARSAGGSESSGLGGLTEAVELGPAEPAGDPLLGRDFGGVTLVRIIAEGGMGRVYEGLQDRPRRPVAVKVMRPGFVSTEACRRFDNEAEVLGRLRHRYIAQIFSAGICNVAGARVPYFVMEYIPNALPITKYVAHHKLPTDERIALFRKVCDAVAHGHEKGVIHRDLKPSNILVEPSGEPKIIDFGVARCIDASPEAMTALTDMGQLIGTVQYMSPEQFAANPAEIDVRADVYALGVILYELLTGKPPYEIRQKQIFEAARVVREQKPISPEKLNKTVRPDVARITGRCLAKDRSRRYANAAEVATAIGSYLSGQPVAEPRRRGFLEVLSPSAVLARLRSLADGLSDGRFAFLATAICVAAVLLGGTKLLIHEFLSPNPPVSGSRIGGSRPAGDGREISPAGTATAETKPVPKDGSPTPQAPPIKLMAKAEAEQAPIPPAQTSPVTNKSDKPAPATDFKYEVKGNAVTITGYLGSDSVVRIPDVIENRPVTVIGHEAFRDRADLVKMHLPKNLVALEGGAFFNCTRLNEVTLPEGLLHIRAGSLVGTALATLNIPASVIDIEDCLYVAQKLREITVDPENQHFVTADGILYDKGLKTLLRCPPVKTGEVLVPLTVEVIAGHAFAGCDALERVILPAGLTRIDNDAFPGCRFRERLDTAALDGSEHYVLYSIRPNGIEVNGYQGKGGAVRIPENIVGRTVFAIASDAFNGQAAVRSVVLPASVEGIGNAAFAGCSSMESIAMPDSLVGIGFDAFHNCKSLKSIDIPARVSNIVGGGHCFRGSSGLTRINVDVANMKFASVDGVLYDKGLTTLILCPAGREGRVTLPSTVTKFLGIPFEGCNRLTHIGIPDSLKDVNEAVFVGCDAVRETIRGESQGRP